MGKFSERRTAIGIATRRARLVVVSLVAALLLAALALAPSFAPAGRAFQGGVGCLPSVTVTSGADAGPGTLRQAIADVCEAGDINFQLAANDPACDASGRCTITLATGELFIDKSVRIGGPPGGSLTVSGNNVCRVFRVASGAVSISNLTVLRGAAVDGGAGLLVIGGEVVASGLNFVGNVVIGGDGGGVGVRGGRLELYNSTVSGNAARHGGGIHHDSASGVVRLVNSTVTNNRADLGEGGGIAAVAGTTTLHNSIVAGNFAGLAVGPLTPNDVHGALDPESASNLFGVGGAGGLTNGAQGNLVGVADAGLEPLAFNGGPTRTHALRPGSPALDRGSNALAVDRDGAAFLTDQRGHARTGDAADAGATADVDIGAFEAHPMIEDVADKTLDEDGTLAFAFEVGDAALGLASVNAASSNTALVPEDSEHLSVAGAGATRTLTLRPSAGQSGFATITLTATSTDGRTISDSFVLSVRAVNDAPSANVPGTQTTSTNAPVTFSLRSATQVYVEDSDADVKAVKVILNATQGRVTLATTAAVHFNVGDGRDDALVSFSGTLASVNAALNGLRFTPNANFNGAATLEVTVSDQGNTGAGGALADTASVRVNVIGPFNPALDCSKDIDPAYTKPSVRSLIGMANAAEVASKREALARYVWGDEGFPASKLPPSGAVARGVTSPIKNLKNLARVDRITLDAPLPRSVPPVELRSVVYHLRPQTRLGRLVIVQQGHVPDIPAPLEPNGIERAAAFYLELGYDVLVLQMPLTGNNSHPSFPFTALNNAHDQLGDYRTPDLNPLKYFVEPVAVSLNHLLSESSYTQVAMTGISGGGWTTTLYAALDPRVQVSIPVAGSLPAYLRTGPCGQRDAVDWEQAAVGSFLDYTGLYLLGAQGAGRVQMQVYNQFDSCCFAGVRYKTYEPTVKQVLAEIGAGAFGVLLDASHREHTISPPVLAESSMLLCAAHATNRPPANSVPAAQTTFEASPVIFSAATNNRVAVGDPDPCSKSLRVTLAATGGSLTLDGVAGLLFASGDGVADQTMTFTGTLADINAALDGMSFLPAPGFVGAARLNLTTDDRPAAVNVAGPHTDADAVNITVNPAPVPLIDFSAPLYSIGERANVLTVTVRRGGPTGAAVRVDYATDDGGGLGANESCASMSGKARARCDFTAALGTLTFAPGETVQTFDLLVADDSFAEGRETLTLRLSNPAGGGARLGERATAAVEITDDVSEAQENPTDAPDFFVRQQYADFLGRAPDAAGLGFWTNQLNECETLPEPGREACREVRRVNVSAAFYLSPEFQETGYFVYRAHQAAFNTGPLLRMPTFLRDRQDVGRGAIDGRPDFRERLEANKRAFLEAFVARAQFTALYPQTMTAAQFVDALNANTGASLSAAERDALVARLSAGTTTRAQALLEVAEDPDFRAREFNRAFIYMQYVGYMRCGPADPPDDERLIGFNFWLGKLSDHGGNYVSAEMVKSFIVSGEYRGRFGPS
ncbi:MAG TPA: choice-of-anchor Q domain-containing protein [Pyrinomonadaceae bacterium]|nr:choice-of-anchor Q domain-containing protein [Pyrinomonadaceae bacterium]